MLALLVAGGAWPVSAQQLLDRVVARVNGTAITLTDLRAAAALGLVEGDGDAGAAAVGALVDRQLMLGEVERFAPPEPAPAAVQDEADRLRRHAGTRLAPVMEQTGLDEARLRDLARESLRIRAYLDQRFGTLQASDDDAERYYREHPAEFSRNGVVMAFEDAATEARRRASAERRSVAVDRWLRDLRARAEIALPGR